MTTLEIPDQPIVPPRRATRAGFAAGVIMSLFLHGSAALLLADGFKEHPPAPPVDAVEVELVPPPEAAPPEPAPVEDELPPEEEPVKEELPPEAAPAEEEAVPPEPEPEPEQPAVEELPDTPEENLAELPIKVLQPVVEFGEEDTAPEGAEDGEPQQAETNVSEPKTDVLPDEQAESQEPLAEEPVVEETVAEEPRELQPEDPQPEGEEPALDEQQPEEIVQDVPPEEPTEPEELAEPTDAGSAEEVIPQEAGPEPEVPAPVEDAEVPEPVELGPSDKAAEEPVAPESGADTLETASDSSGNRETVVAAIPRSKPPAPALPAPSGQRGSNLRPARHLLSGELLADPRVRTAMRGMPEGERLDLLCATELRAQLNNQNPPILPDLLPSFRTPPGTTVLQPRGAAFRSFGRWHNVDFRCVVDHGVTRVQSFSLKVGSPVPRSEWRKRGFPQ